MRIRKKNPKVESYRKRMYASEYWHDFYDKSITPEDDINGYNASIAKFEELKEKCIKDLQLEFSKWHFIVAHQLKKVCKELDGEINYAEYRKLRVKDYYPSTPEKKQVTVKFKGEGIKPTIAPSNNSPKVNQFVRTKKSNKPKP